MKSETHQTNPITQTSLLLILLIPFQMVLWWNHGGHPSVIDPFRNEVAMTLQSVNDLCNSLCDKGLQIKPKKLKHLKAQINEAKKAKPVWMQKESVSKQGRKSTKAEPTVHKDPAFDELDDDAIDYMETEGAQDVGRTRYVVHEEKESTKKEVSTEDALNTAQPKVSTNKEEVMLSQKL
ncbi:hypothetical protein Tco_1211601 [Tanacetum coccineum]